MTLEVIRVEPSPAKKAKIDTKQKTERFDLPSPLSDWRRFLLTSLKHPNDSSQINSEVVRGHFEKIGKIKKSSVYLEAVFDFYSSLIDNFPQHHPRILGLCVHMLSVTPEVEYIPKTSKLNDEIPSKDFDFEETLSKFLHRLPSMDLNYEMKEGLDFQKYLYSLSKFVFENCLPVPVTAAVTEVFRGLMKLHPGTVEPRIGPLLSVILLNVDGVDTDLFLQDVIDVYAKLRQLPKLFSKLLMSVEKEKPTSSLVKSLEKVEVMGTESRRRFASAIVELPVRLVQDIWRTFNYHLSNEGGSRNEKTLKIADVFMAEFFEQICVSDHSTPRSAREKIFGLTEATLEILSSEIKVENLQRSFSKLVGVLSNYRNFQNTNNDDVLTVCDKFSINQDQEVPTKDEDEILENFQLYSSCLSAEDLVRSTNFPFKKEKKIVPEVWLKANRDIIKSDSRVSGAFLVNVVKFISDALDVDVTCEEVFKPLVKKSLHSFLDQTSEEENMKRIKKSFAILDVSLLFDRKNFDLNRNFYFDAILSVLEELPLESLDDSLHSLALLISMTLMVISTEEDVNSRLLRIIARSLDPVYRGASPLFRHLNGAKVVLWLTRIKTHSEADNEVLRTLISFASKSVVKYAHEHVEKWTEFASYVGKIAANLNEVVKEKENEGFEVEGALVFAEALSVPLIYRDASEEKIKVCEDLFQNFKNKLTTEKVTQTFSNEEENVKYSRSVLRLLGMTIEAADPKSREGLGDVAKKGFEFSLKNFNSNRHREILDFCKIFVARQWELGVKAKHFPKNVEKVWNAAFGEDNFFLKEKTELVEVLIHHSESAVIKKNLDKFASYLDKVCESVYMIDVPTRKSNIDWISTFRDQMRFWEDLSLIKIDPSQEESMAARRLALENILGKARTLVGKLRYDSKDETFFQICLCVLKLDAAVIGAEKPVISSYAEANCLTTSLVLHRFERFEGDVGKTLDLWEAVYKVLIQCYLKRTQTLVLSRIPIVNQVYRNLLSKIVDLSNQNLKHEPSISKRIVLYAHFMDRVAEQIKKNKTDFRIVAPHLVSDFVAHMHRGGTIISDARSNLVSAVYKLLDICDKPGKDFIGVVIADEQKPAFRELSEKYLQYHKFTGKV